MRILRAPLADLERALIDTFMHARGLDESALATLPAAQRDALLKEASIYASAKLAEVEARSHYLDELHR
jgi:hypothetical protein